MKDLRQRLLATFRVEYAEHVARIRELLLVFEARGGASTGPELDETFRRAHSLKGAARAVDLRELEALAHRLEALLARVRDHSLELSQPVAHVIQEVLDVTDDLMAALARGDAAPDTSPALAALDRLLAFEPDVPAPLAPPQTHAATAQTNAPSPTPPAARQLADAPTAAEQGGGALETVRIPVEVLDRLLRLSGLLHTEALNRDSVGREAQAAESCLLELERRWDRLRSLLETPIASAGGAASAMVQEIREFDGGVRELGRRQRELRRSRAQSDWTLRQLDQQLQENVRHARLIPAETVFGGFRQMARDLARDLGKEIEFRVRGLDVQADRAVLQELKDPVMHLIRNALDHGLEPTEERLQCGKPGAGALSLTLTTGGGRLQITLSDDGRGIDFHRVRATAVRQRLITEQQAETLPNDELARFILQPGFSTAAFVTDVSGRGMGLSVVTEAVSRFQGTVEITPSAGAGTSVQLTTPLSLSTVSLLIVEADGQRFGLPSALMSQLAHVPIEHVQTLEGRPTALLNGRTLPLVSLTHMLGLGGPELVVQDGRLPVALLQSGAGHVGLVVDELVSHVESVLQDLGPVFSGYPHLLGGVREAGGEILLALNLTALLEQTRRREGGDSFRIVSPEKSEPPHILVVDDSVTTRTLEKSVLEAHGYRVRVAVDGLEALAMLQQDPGDLVIADVEMPRMDGFGLLAAIRKEARLRSLPVVIVTSLEKREHQELGLALGADAYIVKRQFDQSALLETIQRLL